nr:hypothetical protein [Pseudomonas benzenivorans]
MKKITLLLVGLMASGVASAETVDLVAPSTSVDRVTCTLLNEDVSINLTTNVVGAVACDTTGIAIATCHTAGRTTNRSQEVTTCTDPTDPTTCTTAVEVVTGPAVPYATTAKGTVTNEYPSSAACDAAAVQGVAEEFQP